LREIDKQDCEYAHRLFQCVAAASRPLRVEELAEFLAFDFDTGSTPALLVDWRPENPAHAVLSTCSSLLAIVNVDGSQVIQFAHFSVKEYLTSSRLAEAKDSTSRFHISMTPSHTTVAQACLGILLHLDENVTADSRTFPLARYAAEHWVRHARFDNVAPDSKIQDGMRLLFEPRKHHLAVWTWMYDPENRTPCKPSRRHSPARATPLHYAAFCGLHDVVQFLIVERAQDVNTRGFQKETPLGVACREGHLEVARVLLEYGADAEVRNAEDWSPLERASSNGHVKVARVLLEHGADVKARDKNQWTALHCASHYSHPEVARVLLEYGADSNAQSQNKWTPLHWASKSGDLDLALALIKHGADLNAQDNEMLTPLHRASKSGDLEVTRVLLQHGADVNAQDNDKRTSLHWASRFGHRGVARLLLEHGADVKAKDIHNRTPLHLALEYGCKEVAQVLLDYGADANSRDAKSETPLPPASERGGLDIHYQNPWEYLLLP